MCVCKTRNEIEKRYKTLLTTISRSLFHLVKLYEMLDSMSSLISYSSKFNLLQCVWCATAQYWIVGRRARLCVDMRHEHAIVFPVLFLVHFPFDACRVTVNFSLFLSKLAPNRQLRFGQTIEHFNDSQVNVDSVSVVDCFVNGRLNEKFKRWLQLLMER